MRKFGLIGYPLTHSFSQKFFTKKFATENITDCSYENFPMEDLKAFKAFLQANPDIEGLNITIPHKRNIIPFLDEQTKVVEEIKASNCLRIKNGKITGHNTDVYGFKRSFEEFLLPHHTHALVLGTGGASRAVNWVLKQMGIEYLMVSRSESSGAALTYKGLDKKIMEKHTLIINTTPLGTFPKIEEGPKIPYEYLTPQHYLFDLVYNPAETKFLRLGKEKGAAVKNGYDMLVYQAEESWKIWNEGL